MLSCFRRVRLCNPMGHSLPSSSVHGIFKQEYPGIESTSLALAGGFFTTEHNGSLINVGNLLQRAEQQDSGRLYLENKIHTLELKLGEWPVAWGPGDLPNPGIKPRSPALQADSLPAESQRKPKNTGVGCRFLLQGIFPTEGSNPSLPHCRRILYQLSQQGSPRILE